MTEEYSDLEMRDLAQEDVPSLLELLSHLTDAPELDPSSMRRIADSRREAGIVTKVFVHRPTCKVVGTASLLVEPKFTRGGRSVGHIEDVVVDPAYRGKKLGKALLKSLCDIARSRGCYKVILDSAESSIEYYEKLDFRVCERQMRLDL
ncbi:GNAT domain [Trypanosoma melophagium]|uniref:GNAT domain n=1 Tax=Trypanosoma melophagium TaxID=715481 RepID=UPI003519EF5E|nr:GNAT domain [Trypanosoma melophagium]